MEKAPWIRSVLAAAERDEHVAGLLRQTVVATEDGLVRDLFELRNIGIPVAAQ